MELLLSYCLIKHKIAPDKSCGAEKPNLICYFVWHDYGTQPLSDARPPGHSFTSADHKKGQNSHLFSGAEKKGKKDHKNKNKNRLVKNMMFHKLILQYRSKNNGHSSS